MITLYQFPISHYCEKVRWALDFKGLEYQVVNLLPGAHIKVIKSIAAKSEVPVLRQDETVIQGSSEIITHLDKAFPDKSLTPTDPVLKQKALECESFVDENIGPHTRLYCYHYLLESPDTLIPLLAHGQPWFKRSLFRIFYPKVRERIRAYMRINDRTADIALKKLTHALGKLTAEFEIKPFLVGDGFTRADLAAASLLAPFCVPDKYGVPWPEKLPEGLQQTADSLNDKLFWVDALYRSYR